VELGATQGFKYLSDLGAMDEIMLIKEIWSIILGVGRERVPIRVDYLRISTPTLLYVTFEYLINETLFVLLGVVWGM